LEVVNNLFADLQYHGVGLMVNSEGIVQNNTFFNGGSNYWADATSTVQGGYNILNHTAYPYYSDPNDLVNRNPMMVDTLNFTGADSLPFTCDDGYHLQSVSPAIDAGISTVAYGVLIDIFGTPRPTGPSYDIGPVEYTLIGLNAFNNGPGCVGNTIDLSSNPTGGTVPFTYFWAGPNSFTSNLSNPVLSNATVAMSGTYTVMITDAQGCSSSDTTTVTVRPLPDPADSITGTSTLCAGVTNVAYFVSPILNAVNYVWTLPPGATIITGNGSNNIAVDYSLNATSGNISVYGINTCGDGLVSPDFPVVVNPTPAAPIITLSGDTMVSNAYQGNQWYLDNVLIPGATGQRYVAAQLGVYWDLVSLNGCSSDTSNHLYFVVGIAEKNIPGIFISPVPNNGNFKLTIGTALRGKFTISVYNNTGVKIFEAEREVIDGISDYPVDLRPAASGVYTVVLSDNSTEMAKPFLICK
jgi:hypothetical protein